MATWLVTGGCGFIGSHLVDALIARRDRVRVLDDLSSGRPDSVPPAAELIRGDVADGETVERAMAGVDGCFHLAGVASVQRGNEDWRGTHRVNLSGTINVFEAARACRAGAPAPVVYASSAAVYGDSPDRRLAETARAQPLSAYGADKLGCELHGRVAWLVHRVPTTGFRFFNVYGPRMDPGSPYSGVIAIFADRIGAGHGVELFGDGAQLRDFVYVGDVVRYLLAAMERPMREAEVFNVCTGRATSVLDVARILGGIAGREIRIARRPPRVGDIRVSIGDPAKAAEAFGFTADTTVAAGLRRTFASLAPSMARAV